MCVFQLASDTFDFKNWQHLIVDMLWYLAFDNTDSDNWGISAAFKLPVSEFLHQLGWQVATKHLPLNL